MDLLLFLVRKHKMNPLELKISEITDEFVEYVNEMKELNIEIAADFMVMASTLMEIKSRLLLNPSDEAAEKERWIAKHLYEYALIKDAAKGLEEMYETHAKEYHVSVVPLSKKERREEAIPSLFWEVLRSVEAEIKLRKKVYKISKDSYSVAKKLEEVKEFLKTKGRTKIREVLLKARDRLEAIVIFVALLELLRLNFIRLDTASREVFVYGRENSG